MTVYFTSDTHFGHQKIITHSTRPFATLEEMNKTMIERWNSVVKPEDDVYHLGDFAFRNTPGILKPIFDSLNGTKRLLTGNHDDAEVLALGWERISTIHEVKVAPSSGVKKLIVLCHYPIASWNGLYRGAIHFHGHEHGKLTDYNNRCDVGVDSWDYAPVSLDQIIERIADAPRNPIGND